MLANNAAGCGFVPTGIEGIERSLFRNDDAGERSSILRLAGGARFPCDEHHGIEEVVTLPGAVAIGGVGFVEFVAGDCLFAEPAGGHDFVAVTGVEVFSSSQKATPLVE